ncbi:MAG: OmpA family protein [Alphaproteobacteria bacterium]|nr:OmpA family protein [Alphaproteobacteria bacterium]
MSVMKIVLLGACFLLNACVQSNDGRDPYVEEHYKPMHKIKSADVILSDSENAKYGNADKSIFESTKNPIVIEEENSKFLQDNKLLTGAVDKNMPVTVEYTNSGAKAVNYQISTILFDNGLSSVDPSYKDELANIAKIVKQKNARVFVYGYASSKIGKTSVERQKRVNFEMGTKRAESVANVLIKLGVKKDSIVTVSLGDTKPLYSETMADGERLNRRADIYISY